MQSTSFVPSSAAPAATTIEFLHWMLAQLRLEPVESPEDVFRVHFPGLDGEEDSSSSSSLRFTFEPALADELADPPVHLANLQGSVLERLAGKLQRQGIAVHARPLRQPEQVHELTQRLFSAYQVRRGSVRLAGCQLEERPFLRLSVCTRDADGALLLLHQWVDEAGQPIDPELFGSLGLADITRRESAPPRISDADIERLQAEAEQLLQHPSHDNAAADTDPYEVLATAVVWCKYASGKLRFEIDEASAELAFEGWATTLTAPPFRCPETGTETFDLAATDDGQITAPLEIDLCQATQQRVLHSQLVRCAATGKLVLASHASLCPVNGDAVLSESLVACDVCQQEVSPAALRGKACRACRGLRSVRKEDPRLARILGERPGLDRFRSWKLAETRDVYIVVGSTLMQQTLIVLDKQSLAPAHLAHKSRFSRRWTPLAELEREELLGADE